MKRLLVFFLLCVSPALAQQRVKIAGSDSTTVTMQTGAVANGNGTALNVDGTAGAILTVNCASCSGGTQVVFEGQNDGINFFPMFGIQQGANIVASSTTAVGVTGWYVPTAGLKLIRARVATYSAGTVTVTGTVVPLGTTPPVINANVVSGGGTGGTNSNFGSSFPAPGTAAGFTDGTNMRAAKVFDTDTGGATEYTLGVNLRQAGNGGSTEVTFPTDAADGAAVTSPPVPAGGVYYSSPSTIGNGQAGYILLDNVRRQVVTLGGTNSVNANQSGTWTVQPGNTANTTPWIVNTPDISNVTTGQVNVTSGGVQIVAARAGRVAVEITNLGTNDIYIGASGVTTSTGDLLLGTKGAAVKIYGAMAVYGIVASTTTAVSYREEY